jgi:hypothetical protein
MIVVEITKVIAQRGQVSKSYAPGRIDQMASSLHIMEKQSLSISDDCQKLQQAFQEAGQEFDM